MNVYLNSPKYKTLILIFSSWCFSYLGVQVSASYDLLKIGILRDYMIGCLFASSIYCLKIKSLNQHLYANFKILLLVLISILYLSIDLSFSLNLLTSNKTIAAHIINISIYLVFLFSCTIIVLSFVFSVAVVLYAIKTY